MPNEMKTPLRFEDNKFIVGADCELICQPTDATPEEARELVALANDGARWREYCRMICERDNDGQEAFGNLIPDGELTKDRLDIAMDAWLQQRAGG